MIPRYALINEFEKNLYEKKWQLPYGYSNCAISTNPNEAGQWLDNIIEMGENPKDWYVEKIDEFGGQSTFHRK